MGKNGWRYAMALSRTKNVIHATWDRAFLEIRVGISNRLFSCKADADTRTLLRSLKHMLTEHPESNDEKHRHVLVCTLIL